MHDDIELRFTWLDVLEVAFLAGCPSVPTIEGGIGSSIWIGENRVRDKHCKLLLIMTLGAY